MPKSSPIPSTSSDATASPHLPAPVFYDHAHHIKIFHGGFLEILAAIPENCVDLIFADPPYFLSNNGITCHASRMVSVNKGDWDKLPGAELGPARARYDKVHEFNRAWLAACQRVLKPNGSPDGVLSCGIRFRLWVALSDHGSPRAS